MLKSENSKTMTNLKNTSRRSDPASPRALWQLAILLIVFAAIAGAVAYLVFINVQRFVSSWEITSLPGMVVKSAQTPTAPGGSLAETAPSPTVPAPMVELQPQEWDGASRVTLLVMGLDYRDWQAGEGAPRSDTMILVSADPINKTAGILSIPRDLWVNIPGFEPARINAAYRLGELYKMPGGGPGLAMRTVEELLGLQVDYYAQIDFYAFERFIDEIGGVKIDVPATIKIDPIGDNNTKVLQPGRQVLPGSLALAYARARYTEGGDFDRGKRQLQVIFGVRNRLLNTKDLFPLLINKAPILYSEISAGVHTNLTLEQAIQLAWLVRQIPEENIKQGIISTEYVNFYKSPEGDDVLKPLPQKIRLLRDEIFTSDLTITPMAKAGKQELMQSEGATVALLNGAATGGLASRTKDFLGANGVNVVSTGDSPEAATYTTIIDYTGNPKTVGYLVEVMKINPNKIFFRYDPTNQTDILLTLGYDWANDNPLP
jgi:LCP family protein required for cell wall assembly